MRIKSLLPYVATCAFLANAALLCALPANSYAQAAVKECRFVPPSENWTGDYLSPRRHTVYYPDWNWNDKINSKDKLLHSLIRDGNAEAVSQLMEAGHDPNEWNHFWYSPLHIAAHLGLLDIVGALLEGGADPSMVGAEVIVPDPSGGRHYGSCGITPLHFAARAGHLDVVNALLASGADPNAADFWGQSPLQYGAAQGHAEVLRALLESGAERSLKDTDGKTALDDANDRQHFEAVKVLLTWEPERSNATRQAGRSRKG